MSDPSPFQEQTTFRKIEATIGAFAAIFLGFVLLCAMIVALLGCHSGAEQTQVLVCFVPVLSGDFVFFLWLKEALEVADYPFAPWFALRQWRWPLPLRPLVAAWWLAHFAALVFGTMFIQYFLMLKLAPAGELLPRIIAAVVVSFTSAYAANLFLLLALTSLTRSGRLVLALWRRRFWIDAVIALGSTFMPLLDRPAPPVRMRHATAQSAAVWASLGRDVPGRFALLIAINNFSPVAGMVSSSATSGER